MIHMNNKYYIGVVMHLIIKLPEFQKIVESTCPTRWVDGSICLPADDTVNKAFLEAEYIVELLESTLCYICSDFTCDKYNCELYMEHCTCKGAPSL